MLRRLKKYFLLIQRVTETNQFQWGALIDTWRYRHLAPIHEDIHLPPGSWSGESREIQLNRREGMNLTIWTKVVSVVNSKWWYRNHPIRLNKNKV